MTCLLPCPIEAISFLLYFLTDSVITKLENRRGGVGAGAGVGEVGRGRKGKGKKNFQI